MYCRVKPHAMSSVRCMPDQCGLQIAVDGKDHALEFDKVYGPGSTQEQVSSRGFQGCPPHYMNLPCGLGLWMYIMFTNLPALVLLHLCGRSSPGSQSWCRALWTGTTSASSATAR